MGSELGLYCLLCPTKNTSKDLTVKLVPSIFIFEYIAIT